MKKRVIIGVSILFFVAVTAALFSSQQPIGIHITDYIATNRSFRVTVRATGELDAVRSTTISSELDGDKSRVVWLIKDGARVEKGDPLVRFDPSAFEDNVRTMENKVMELESMVDANSQIYEWEKSQLEREIQTMEIDLRAAELDLVKLEKGEGPLELLRMEEKEAQAEAKLEKFVGYEKELREYLAKGTIESNELEGAAKEIRAARREYEMAHRELANYRDYVLPTGIEKAKAMVSRAEVNLEQNKKNGGYKIGKAQASLTLAQKELKSSRAMLDKAREKLKKTEILAPLPGMAVHREEYFNGEKRKPRIGDRVLRNQPIVYVPDISEMLVNTKIREIDLYKVSPGKKALVRVEAYPDLVLNGTVEGIGVLAETDTASNTREKYFSVEILIKGVDTRLRPGMTAQVEILCADLDQVLTVPVHSIFVEDGLNYCMVLKKGDIEKTAVTVGAVNEYWAEIQDGLTSGDRVSLATLPDIR